MIFWRMKCDILFYDETLIYYMLFTCWENEVLQKSVILDYVLGD